MKRAGPESKLEPISKLFEEDDEASELHEAEESLRIELPLHKNAALPLNPGEEPFDQPSPCVSPKTASILRRRFAAIGSARSFRCRLRVGRYPADRYHRRDHQPNCPASLQSYRSQSRAVPRALRDGLPHATYRHQSCALRQDRKGRACPGLAHSMPTTRCSDCGCTDRNRSG